MTDRTALLAAILREPADDLPRMVFADWLDDRGEHERAAYIRRTVAGEQNGWINGGLERDWHPRYKVVKVLNATSRLVRSEWVPLACVWHRGFIVSVRGPLALVREHLPAIVREHPVERAEATDAKPDEATWPSDDHGLRGGSVVYGWFRAEVRSSQNASFIPNATFDRMPGGVPTHRASSMKWYQTEEGARAALSFALLDGAKSYEAEHRATLEMVS